jgi:hypothetical protein
MFIQMMVLIWTEGLLWTEFGSRDGLGWLVQLSPSRYAVPKGTVGRRFLTILTQEFRQVRKCQWNSDQSLVFAAMVQEPSPGVKRTRDICRRLERQMDLWEQFHHVALINNEEALLLARAAPASCLPDPETKAWAFNAKVLLGCLVCSAVRNITSREGGGVLQPDAACTKTGQPVVEVLQEKHPQFD